MAQSYSPATSHRSVQVLGPTQVADVQQAGFVTHPTGIYAEYPVPLPVWKDDRGAGLIEAIASGIEGLIASTAAVTGSYVQDLDANGLLVDYIEFVVEYVAQGGLGLPMTTTVLIPLESFLAAGDPFFFQFAGNPAQLIDDAYQGLAQFAAQ